MVSPVEGDSVQAVIREVVKRQVQVLQAGHHVAEHVARDALNPVPQEHEVQQRPGEVGGDVVEPVVGEVDGFEISAAKERKRWYVRAVTEL